MSHYNWEYPWEGTVVFPDDSRLTKPRNTGITMVMDKGLGCIEISELLSVAGRYIDYVKLAFGTSALYSEQTLKKKISIIRKHNIKVYPGGTFMEIAVMQNRIDSFLKKARELGFTAVEVSDGTVAMLPSERASIIEKARFMGFRVLTEVGKKSPVENMTVGEMAGQIRSDLEAGADQVIVEARESGKGIGIYDEQGKIRNDFFIKLRNHLPDTGVIIWEAPLKSQQYELISVFGTNVSLGNIPPEEVLALEALRVGLRGDTLKDLIQKKMTAVPV